MIGTRFGKADIMQGFATAGDACFTVLIVACRSGDDVRVRIFCDTALVAFALQHFNTGHFVRRDGEWRVVAWQATAIPAATP